MTDIDARQDACNRARDVLFGMEYDPEDILVVADWLLDGKATLAVEFADQRARNHGQRHDDLGPDAASWSAVHDPVGDDEESKAGGAQAMEWQ